MKRGFRIKNRAYLDSAKKRRCEVCFKFGCDPDHIHTRGAGGGDEPANIIFLCREHHNERHQSGIKTFVQKYNLPITWDFGYPRRSDL